ncbi:hypothetical protein PMAYCL1PPCAC_33057, partial [Pristionchus mayeri]
SSVYIFSAASIGMDRLMILIHVVYQIPAILMQASCTYAIFQSWLFDDGMHSTPVVLLFFVFKYCWYYNTLSHVLMSTTRIFRLYAIVRGRILSNGRSISLVIVIQLISIGSAVLSQFITPCCRTSFAYYVYSYVYETRGSVTNYSNYVIDLPMNISSTACSLLCYSGVSYRLNDSESAKINSNYYENMHVIFRYAMHFAAVAAFHFISWLTLRILPPLSSDPSQDWLKGVTTLFVLLNSWSAAFLFLLNNTEV